VYFVHVINAVHVVYVSSQYTPGLVLFA